MNGVEMTIIGNIVRFELRFASTGKAWGTGSVAVNEYGQKNGERTETTTYIDFKVFGDMAEHMAETVDKGTRVIVTGKLRNEKWTASDGTERRSMTLYVDEAGPSLRWATASVTRVGNGGGARQGGGSPAPAASSDFGSDASGLDDNPFL